MKWLTVEEAARRLSVSRATIYRWAQAGRIQIYKLGPKSSRIKAEDLERLEAEAPLLYLGDSDNGTRGQVP